VVSADHVPRGQDLQVRDVALGDRQIIDAGQKAAEARGILAQVALAWVLKILTSPLRSWARQNRMTCPTPWQRSTSPTAF